MRVNVINPTTGKTVLRNATTIGGFEHADTGTPMAVVIHRNERFPVAVPQSTLVAYIPRTRNAAA